MVPVPAVANVVKIRFLFGLGAPIQSGAHFYMGYGSGTFTKAALDALAAQVVTNVNLGGSVKALWGPWVQLTEVTVEDLAQPGFPLGIATTATFGTNGSGNLPASACALLNFRIARRYRGGHPRIYLPGGGESSLNGTAQWTTTYQALCVTNWNYFVGAVAGYTGPPALTQQVSVSYRSGKTARVTPVVDPVLGTTCSLILGSQRKRLGR